MILYPVLLMFLVTVISVTSQHANLKFQWNLFKKTYNKHYSSEAEEKMRYYIFDKHLQIIDYHNHLYQLGQVSFKVGINRFMDLMPDEYNLKLINVNRNALNMNEKFYRPSSNEPVPDSIDWRELGAVTAVRDQIICSSFALSAVDALEGQNFVKTHTLTELSVQQLIDCMPSGCSGDFVEKVFDYVKNNSGIDTAKSYPYEGSPDVCRFKLKNVGAICTGYVNVQSKNETALKIAVAAGPVAVAIDASQPSFQMYRSGIYADLNCTTDLNHGLLIVGYGSTHGADYWIAKNSWGTNWGENGYVRIARNLNNCCGIATDALYPNV